MDDEPIVLAMIGTSLNRHGYRVLLAATADEAILVSDTYEHSIDLLIADHTLKQREEVTSKLLETRPAMHVLQISGCVREVLIAKGQLLRNEWFLEKPFMPNDLMEVVRDILAFRTPK